MKTYAVVRDAVVSTHTNADLASKFEKLARCDALTGLDNRTSFTDRLAVALEEPARSGVFAVLWIDLDRFKEINDSLGHPAGDAVLITVAERLRRLIGRNGLLARFGGDEFVMMVRLARASEVDRLGNDLLTILAQPFLVDGLAMTVTASVGGAVSPNDGNNAELLLKHADMALYHAKARGRNAFCAFDVSMKEELLARRDMEANLRVALSRRELEVHYQPVIDLATNRFTGCEALLRWNHPVQGWISPAIFIPLAEATGQIAQLTEYVLEEACAAAASWPKDLIVSVNISPVLLKQADFSPNLLKCLRMSGLEPHRLELEITETVLVEDSQQANVMLREFQRLGLRLALDDFGTGFSSLSYLLKYSFNRIKIDRSFVTDLESNPGARAIILAIVNLAQTLGMEVVAEGVETENQLAYIRSVGCGHVQGYYFARPMPEGQAIQMIIESRAAAGETTRPDARLSRLKRPSRALSEPTPAGASPSVGSRSA